MNYFPKAIELCSTDQDWKAIVIAAAKKQPKLIVDIIIGENNSWIPEATEFMRCGEKVKAIKFCRNATRMGLKEAKEAVEALTYYPQGATAPNHTP